MISKEPIRILQIVPNMQSGGLENFIMNIYRHVDRKKIQFDFLVHYQEEKFFDKEIEKLGGKIFRFSLRNDNNILKYIKKLNAFYKNHPEYRVIHCHMSSIGFINFLIAKKNGIKVRIAHSHNSKTDKTLKGKVKRLLMLPYKYESTINYACSNKAGKYLFGKKSYEVIPNAIEIEAFKYNKDLRKEIRKQLNISDETVLLGHIGRFNIQKNHAFLLKIFKEIQLINKNTKLILIGDGELKNQIYKMAQQYDLNKNIIYTGTISNTFEYYNAMDAFLLPSLFEGLPVVGIESQTNGLKCYFSSNITKEVSISENTFFLKLDNPKCWAQKIIENKFDRTTKINNEKYNIKKVAKNLQERYIGLYENAKQ